MIETIDQIKSLESVYTFTRPGEVSGFLQDHHYLVSLLIDAHKKIVGNFGMARVRLEVVHDPEVKGYIKLFGYIATSMTSDEAGRLLNKFDREWFLKQLPRTQGFLNFDLEFDKTLNRELAWT